MLYNLFELPRDPNLKSNTFGSSATIGYDLGRSYRSLITSNLEADAYWSGPRAWDGTLTVGLTVGFEGAPRQLPLYKSVEVWSNLQHSNPRSSTGRSRPVGHPVVLERLYYRHTKGYLPYCWRYIDPGMAINSLVHCDNLEQIHGELQNLNGEIAIQDPRQVYLDSLSASRAHCPAERLDHLQAYVNNINTDVRFSRHVHSERTIADLLSAMERSLSFSYDTDTLLHRRGPMHVYQDWVEPVRYVGDPITNKNPSGPISTERLMKFAQTAPFDVSPPAALCIKHPDITQINTKACCSLAEALDKVRLTDYSITIQMISGRATAHKWEYSINRYAAIYRHSFAKSAEFSIPALYDIANLAFYSAASDITRQAKQISEFDFLEASEVEIIKTFADEALVTLTCKGVVINAWHIDTAMLAFCSMGLAVEAPYFNTNPPVKPPPPLA